MTVSLPSQQPQPSKETQAARKRRRRAPAGGAADDCFACVKRGAKCDRRRPYCSQCLEVGNECSGYKTQLTWGVGVASRGKLRGLSLPIAKSPPVAPVIKKQPARSRANTTSSQWSDHGNKSPTISNRDEFELHNGHPASLPTTPFAAYHDFSRYAHGESMSPPTPTGWGNVSYPSSMGAHEHPKMHRLNTSLGHFPLITEGLSSSVDAALNEVEYTLSPLSQFSRDELPYMHSPALMYDSYSSNASPVPQSPASAIMIEQRAPTSCPSLVYAPSEPSSSLGSHHDGFEHQMSHARLLSDADSLSVHDIEPYSTSPATASFWSTGILKEEDNGSNLFSQSSAAAAAAALAVISPYDAPSMQISADLIAKMPFFMDYYENIMCPSMVLIDGPTNPFRDHILRLAANSRSLQHAICALAACNLRMKRKLSLGQHGKGSPERFLSEQSESQPEDSSLTEEYQHRNLAVHLLNQQLNDPNKSCHDSVLGTILLLCHYRMVESGIAKFATQFAGVKKILSMRNTAPYQTSNDSAWMEAIFTYFDAISASINDREAQLNHSFYGVSSDINLLPAGAENWIGCDRELFRTISKLGRLNLLSQYRAVSSAIASPTGRLSVPRIASPLGSPLGNTFKSSSQLTDFFNLGIQSKGFGNQLDEEELFAGSCSSPSYDDQRSTFWREWKEARNALQSWEFDSARIVASLPGTLTATQIRDLGSLSEAFRYAALLYTERLASPNVPSSHNNFRNLVSQVVYYTTSIESGGVAEKFLLWPLFVAGSECVNELQQNIVRNKCRDIMSRSGYMNNLSAIEVLERLWAGDLHDSISGSSKLGLQARGPFNWTKCIGGPGVDVEWIMF
ncbi:fungal-specific transcription factor domain-containing protein [Truncatella angustata]|uniref:Fungal-specific transcription factor domain-containing protein n=1 Tax=Truncatella angustata TaxID=152316 RepID=A0A9P8UHL1_9PEZI|nr:fungal-specific transcription factor domain-containing protein [Truncatella angustata]KAH6652234.1 fungal-specific transcription factor domain-containing protein [Truncatella angustata]